MKTDLWSYVNSINAGGKPNMMVDTENDRIAEKDYNSFMVNRFFSYFPDTIFYANEMNFLYDTPNRLQYDFLINIVRPSKRYAKWGKKFKDSDVEAIQEYYGYNMTKAIQALPLLSDNELDIIRKKLEKGG